MPDADPTARAEALRGEYLAAIAEAGDSGALEAVRVAALGRKGRVAAAMRGLADIPPGERRAAGQALNRLKDEIAAAIDSRKAALDADRLEARLAAETVDVTAPARPEAAGAVHPVSQALDELTEIFADMGFAVAEGPDIEDDFHNFTALNIPPEHPARQMHDTFYFAEDEDGSRALLRTHTSPVQIRRMTSAPPPHRIVVPGRTYRRDHDMTHTPMFHQLEGLLVDRGVHMGHLKGCLVDFAAAFFEVADAPLRFRPSYFPFTEPSAEVDIGCNTERGEFRAGHTGGPGDDWLEILGCGMVHPRVLENCGLDPAEHQGFAFGMGIDRLAMLKYGVRDLRSFFDGDLRWLRRHGFRAGDAPTLGQGLGR